MFKKYDIIRFDRATSDITFRFDGDKQKIITVNLDTQFPAYEPCYDYYFDSSKKMHKFPKSNSELSLFIDKVSYTKCYQYQFDKYNTKYPICDNGLLYKYLVTIYNKLYKL